MRRTSLFLALVLGGAASCGDPGPTVEITARRTASRASSPVVPGASARERFGGFDMGARRETGSDDMAEMIDYELPAGWKKLPSTGERLVNLQPAGNAEASCYLSFLPGSGGGLEGNVNRWLAQFDGVPLSADEIAALPRHELLGREAVLVEVTGTFKGMGSGAPRAGFALLGLIVSEPTGSLFLKFTGPAPLVGLERERFFALASSLHMHEAHASGAMPEDGGGGALVWQAPPGWREAGPRPMREVTFTIGTGAAGGECYVARAGGGLLPNLNRWCEQLEQPPLTREGFEALERVSLLGVPSPLLELTGAFTGMDGVRKEGQALLGVACVPREEGVFVKLVGPEELVRAERANFLALVASLEERP